MRWGCILSGSVDKDNNKHITWKLVVNESSVWIWNEEYEKNKNKWTKSLASDNSKTTNNIFSQRL